jgi:hypothetical protein
MRLITQRKICQETQRLHFKQQRDWNCWCVESEGARVELWLGYSPPYNVEVKNAWSYTSAPQYAFMAWCSVKKKHGDNFTFTYFLPNRYLLTIHDNFTVLWKRRR